MVEIVDFKSRNKQINEDVVETLKTYLDLAQKGELREVAVAGVLNTGDTYTCTCRSDVYPTLIGAISILHHRALLIGNTFPDNS